MNPYSQHPGYGGSGWRPEAHHTSHPVPQYQQQPQFTLPEQWRYRPRRAFLENKALRAGTLVTLLALCGLVILAIVQQSVGTEGFIVGLALSVLPVPLLVGTFMWIDRVEPEPWRNLLFAFAWGACAATLVSIVANTWTTEWLVSVNDAGSDTLSSAVVAPVVEEIAKAGSIVLLFLFRRRDFDGIVDGVVIAGITATGFAFTENILYLGHAFGEDLALGSGGPGEMTIITFFMRVIMSPFAHPLFTCMTGVGFGLAALGRNGAVRVLAPLGGLLLAMFLHGLWNGSSSFGLLGFVLVYGMFMVPVFGLMVWLAVWSRNNELKTVGRQLPVYASAGWISHPEAMALSSMKARKLARDLAQHTGGKAGVQAMREYQGYATSLAFLRSKAARGIADPEFSSREQELLHHLWQRKPVAQPTLTRAAMTLLPPPPRYAPAPPAWPSPYGRPQPYQPPAGGGYGGHPGQGYGGVPGHGYGYDCPGPGGGNGPGPGPGPVPGGGPAPGPGGPPGPWPGPASGPGPAPGAPGGPPPGL